MAALPTIHRVSDARPYTWGEAMRDWTPYAETALTETAAQYHGTISRSELARRVQEDSGVVTIEPWENWIDRLLAHVAKHLAAENSLPLVALCVDDDGYVGREYIQLPASVEFDTTTGIEENAAAHRLLCYQEFSLDVPADGGVPGPRPRPKTRGTRSANPRAKAAPRSPAAAGASRVPRSTTPRIPKPPKKQKAADMEPTLCPNCFMQLPGSGICDNC